MKINEKIMINKEKFFMFLSALLLIFRLCVGIFFIFSAIAILFDEFDINFSVSELSAKDYIIIMLLFLLIDSLASDYLNKIYQKNNLYREYLVKELEKSDLIENSESNKDILLLMLNNNDEIREYFKISKNQAKSSFYFSIIACIVGIVMICLALYGVFANKDFEYAIIGTVSGAITELIAGIVLVIHNKSALQLNYYYDALHQNEKFLSAVNMADKLNNEKREEMYIEIIRKQIEIHNAEKTEFKE